MSEKTKLLASILAEWYWGLGLKVFEFFKVGPIGDKPKRKPYISIEYALKF
jgi:hypothetical protein